MKFWLLSFLGYLYFQKVKVKIWSDSLTLRGEERTTESGEVCVQIWVFFIGLELHFSNVFSCFPVAVIQTLCKVTWGRKGLVCLLGYLYSFTERNPTRNSAGTRNGSRVKKDSCFPTCPYSLFSLLYCRTQDNLTRGDGGRWELYSYGKACQRCGLSSWNPRKSL